MINVRRYKSVSRLTLIKLNKIPDDTYTQIYEQSRIVKAHCDKSVSRFTGGRGAEGKKLGIRGWDSLEVTAPLDLQFTPHDLKAQ